MDGDLWGKVVVAVLAFASAYGLWYVKDRRKDRAEAAVAEKTVGSDVTLKQIGTDSAIVAFVNEAFRVERESKDREIGELNQKIVRLEHENTELRAEVAQLHARLNRLDPNGEVVT